HALQSDFAPLLEEAGLLRDAAQHQNDIQLGHYPDGNYMYYLTGFRPISKFVDFYPWVAEVGRQDVHADLAKASKVVLALELEGSTWKYPNAVTLAPELAFAKNHLIRENFGWRRVYVSPSLAMQGGAGTEATLTAMAAPVGDVPVAIAGAWTKAVGEPP